MRSRARAFCCGVYTGLRMLGGLMAQNVNGLLFLAGLLLLVSGVRTWSPAAAYVVAGAIAMAIGVTPYMLKLRKGKS
jgi:hypothetical protein